MSDSSTVARVSSSERKLEAWAPRAGEIIGGRYRVQGVIGSGGMGAVVSAEHIQLGEQVAIKFLSPHLAQDNASVERFVREARATSRIKSEHVVRVLDVGATPGAPPYIVMELLRGQDLSQLLEHGPLAIVHAVDFVLQASEALAEAHAAGIVHRDIKPPNLWLTQRSDGSPLIKVLDFGISKLAPTSSADLKLTETQSVFGSPTYMSPEQIRSSKKVDHRTDIWALGIVLHELLTARLPFDGDTVSGVLASIAADPPMPLRQLRPDAPPELEAAILRCLEKDLARRCSSVKEMAAMLRSFASPLGLISADRIARMGGPQAPLSPSAGTSSSSEHSAVGLTDRSLATSHSVDGTARSTLLGVAVGVGAASILVIVGIAALRVKDPPHDRLASSAAPVTSASALPSLPLAVASAAPVGAPAGAPAAFTAPSSVASVTGRGTGHVSRPAAPAPGKAPVASAPTASSSAPAPARTYTPPASPTSDLRL